MKRNILLLFMLLSSSLLLADLDIDIPFPLNIIGEDHSEVGDYDYESEWINVTNNGSSTQTYFLMYSYDTEALPTGWTFSLCNPVTCYMPFFNIPIELAPGATEQLSAHIHVASTGGMEFNITFSGGDLSEPISYDFTFNTADNVNSEENILVMEGSLTNYPNPFNPETTISFTLTESAPVDLGIYNLNGQLIRTLTSGDLPAGNNSFSWEGKDRSGDAVSSGLYFYKLESGSYTSTKKMMLIE